jgi:hypothetical protein
VATLLARLKPVGGKADAFGGAATLTDALSKVLADESTRKSIIAVRLSVAEAGTNSHGIATITYEHDDSRHQLSFVRDEAVSTPAIAPANPSAAGRSMRFTALPYPGFKAAVQANHSRATSNAGRRR